MATREEVIASFTFDDEIDNWEVGDDTMELRGWMECVEGTQMVPTQFSRDPTALFKIIVNDGKSKRVKVQFWGKNATKHSSQISERSVITITRAKAREPNIKYVGPLMPNAPCELTVLSSTKVEIDAKKFEEVPMKNGEPIPKVLLKDAADNNDKMYVYGWIKIPFELITTGGGSFGSAVIVDHDYKMRVHVANYSPRSELLKGKYVKVECTYAPFNKEGYGLICRSMQDIEIDISEGSLEPQEMRTMGFRTPKRKLEFSNGLAPKRTPFD